MNSILIISSIFLVFNYLLASESSSVQSKKTKSQQITGYLYNHQYTKLLKYMNKQDAIRCRSETKRTFLGHVDQKIAELSNLKEIISGSGKEIIEQQLDSFLQIYPQLLVEKQKNGVKDVQLEKYLPLIKSSSFFNKSLYDCFLTVFIKQVHGYLHYTLEIFKGILENRSQDQIRIDNNFAIALKNTCVLLWTKERESKIINNLHELKQIKMVLSEKLQPKKKQKALAQTEITVVN